MRPRPAGVTVIAVLQFIGTAICALCGVAFLVAGGAIAATLAQQGGAIGGSMVAAIVGVGSIFFLIFAAIWLITAIGMLKLKNWARWLTIIFTGLSAIAALVVAVVNILHGQVGFAVVRLIFLAIYGLILWYMFTPEVIQAFSPNPNSLTAGATR